MEKCDIYVPTQMHWCKCHKAHEQCECMHPWCSRCKVEATISAIPTPLGMRIGIHRTEIKCPNCKMMLTGYDRKKLIEHWEALNKV